MSQTTEKSRTGRPATSRGRYHTRKTGKSGRASDFFDPVFQAISKKPGFGTGSFYNAELKIAIEHNGAHHYSAQVNWSGEDGLEIQKLHDETRRQYCSANGIVFIEIRELGKITSVEEMRAQVWQALLAADRTAPPGFDEVDLSNLPRLSESELYWVDVVSAAKTNGFEIISDTFLGADKPILVRCAAGHITKKTPRLIRGNFGCQECFRKSRRKAVQLSDGRIFESGAAAARALGVWKETVNHAVRFGKPVKGFFVSRSTLMPAARGPIAPMIETEKLGHV